MPIAAGRLKEIAAVQRPQRVQKPSGGWTTTYADVLNPMYCDVRQMQPSADMIASQETLMQPFQFVTRYRTDIVFEIGDRITWRGRYFALKGFDWDINRTQLTITAVAENESTSNGEGS